MSPSAARASRAPLKLGARGRRWFDGLLATALLLPMLAYTTGAADDWWWLPLGVAQIVPLYWRRSHPVAVFAAVALLSGLQALVQDTPMWSQVAFPVATYSVARYAPARWGWVALVVGTIGAVVGAVDWVRGFGGPLERDPLLAYFVSIDAFVVVAWALGSLGRIRQAYVDALIERGERIEQQAAQQAQLAALDERARIARELHDVIAHGLTVIVVQADGARYAAAQDPQAAGDALATIADTGRSSLTEMRRMLGLLRAEDSGLVPLPGLAELAALITDAGPAVTADLQGLDRPVPGGASLTAYRLVQEALTNVRKHAGPGVTTRVEVRVGVDDIAIRVEDDGRGAAAEHTAGDDPGHGLAGMRERVALHSGDLHAGPRPGGGYAVSARLPL